MNGGYVLDLTAAILMDDFAHELAGAVTFFGSLTDLLQRGAALEAEDLAIAAEETARMEALLRELRVRRSHHIQPRPLKVSELVATARQATGSEREARHIGWRQPPCAPDLEVHADAALATHVVTVVAEAATWIAADGTDLEVLVSGGATEVTLALTVVGARELPQSQPWWRLQPGVPQQLALARRMARIQGQRIEDVRHADGITLRWIVLRHDGAI